MLRKIFSSQETLKEKGFWCEVHVTGSVIKVINNGVKGHELEVEIFRRCIEGDWVVMPDSSWNWRPFRTNDRSKPTITGKILSKGKFFSRNAADLEEEPCDLLIVVMSTEVGGKQLPDVFKADYTGVTLRTASRIATNMRLMNMRLHHRGGEIHDYKARQPVKFKVFNPFTYLPSANSVILGGQGKDRVPTSGWDTENAVPNWPEHSQYYVWNAEGTSWRIKTWNQRGTTAMGADEWGRKLQKVDASMQVDSKLKIDNFCNHHKMTQKMKLDSFGSQIMRREGQEHMKLRAQFKSEPRARFKSSPDVVQLRPARKQDQIHLRSKTMLTWCMPDGSGVEPEFAESPSSMSPSAERPKSRIEVLSVSDIPKPQTNHPSLTLIPAGAGVPPSMYHPIENPVPVSGERSYSPSASMYYPKGEFPRASMVDPNDDSDGSDYHVYHGPRPATAGGPGVPTAGATAGRPSIQEAGGPSVQEATTRDSVRGSASEYSNSLTRETESHFEPPEVGEWSRTEVEETPVVDRRRSSGGRVSYSAAYCAVAETEPGSYVKRGWGHDEMKNEYVEYASDEEGQDEPEDEAEDQSEGYHQEHLDPLFEEESVTAEQSRTKEDQSHAEVGQGLVEDGQGDAVDGQAGVEENQGREEEDLGRDDIVQGLDGDDQGHVDEVQGHVDDDQGHVVDDQGHEDDEQDGPYEDAYVDDQRDFVGQIVDGQNLAEDGQGHVDIPAPPSRHSAAVVENAAAVEIENVQGLGDYVHGLQQDGHVDQGRVADVQGHVADVQGQDEDEQGQNEDEQPHDEDDENSSDETPSEYDEQQDRFNFIKRRVQSVGKSEDSNLENSEDQKSFLEVGYVADEQGLVDEQGHVEDDNGDDIVVDSKDEREDKVDFSRRVSETKVQSPRMSQTQKSNSPPTGPSSYERSSENTPMQSAKSVPKKYVRSGIPDKTEKVRARRHTAPNDRVQHAMYDMLKADMEAMPSSMGGSVKGDVSDVTCVSID